MSDSDASANLVLESRHGAVLLLTLNRPERHHAMNQALCTAIEGALERAKNDPEVRAVVLTGGGEKAFCAGADMVERSGADGGEQPQGNGTDGVYAALDDFPLPIIAAINGHCYGGGARVAVGCDIRLASDTAGFRLPGTEYGIVVAGAHLPRIVGAARAKEIIFTAKKFGAQEALEWGLVSAVLPREELVPAAIAMAEQIAANSSSAVRSSKAVIDEATLHQAAVEMEVEANKVLRGTDEQVARFREATTRVTGR